MNNCANCGMTPSDNDKFYAEQHDINDIKSNAFSGRHNFEILIEPTQEQKDYINKMQGIVKYKYNEDKYLEELKQYIDNTYNQHYQSEDDSELQCIDVWIALGSCLTSCRDVIMKYLWRVGKKGNNDEFRRDVKKAIHYCMFVLYCLDNKKK